MASGMPWFSKAERKWQKWFQVVSAVTKRPATLRPEWSSTVRRRICFCAAGHHWWMVDGAVVLPKLADVSPAKTAVSANAGRRSREQKRKVRFQKGLHAGTGTDKAEKTLQLIGHELKIGRAGQAQTAQEKRGRCLARRPGGHRRWPWSGTPHGGSTKPSAARRAGSWRCRVARQPRPRRDCRH